MSDTPNAIPPEVAAAMAAAASSQYVTARSAQYRIIYSNIFKSRIGPNDLALVFGILSDATGAPVANVWQEEATIVMAWPQVKILAKFLSEVVEAAEGQLGPIPTSELQQPKGVATIVSQQLEPLHIRR